VVGVRPQELRLVAPDDGKLGASVDVVEVLGASALVRLQTRAAREGELRVLLPAEEAPAPGDNVGVTFSPGSVHVFRADDGRRLGFEPA
ncbi:MAG: TOBE domain-containing protein, partial [bacterium]